MAPPLRSTSPSMTRGAHRSLVPAQHTCPLESFELLAFAGPGDLLPRAAHWPGRVDGPATSWSRPRSPTVDGCALGLGSTMERSFPTTHEVAVALATPLRWPWSTGTREGSVTVEPAV